MKSDDMPIDELPEACEPIMDEEDVAKSEYLRGYKEAAWKGLAHLKAVLCAINAWNGSGHFACRCAMAAHGMWSSLTERDQVEIANHFRCEKANVNKLIKLIQKRLGLPPALGQRNEDSCNHMRAARMGQLPKHQEPKRSTAKLP